VHVIACIPIIGGVFLKEEKVEQEVPGGPQASSCEELSPDDEDITMSDTTIPSIELQGPIMRSRV
jgi:hypothetical protein